MTNDMVHHVDCDQSWAVARTVSATLALGLLTLAGAAYAQDPVLIGVIFPTQNQERWAWEEKLLTAQAEANGDKVIFQFSNESAATQKNQAETLIQRGVDVLIMAAIDAQAGSDLVNQAQAEGIKVITYDRGVSAATPDFHISRNNYDMGMMQAQSALAAAPCGKYAIIRGDKSTLAQVEMSRAYDEVVASKECIEVVHDATVPGWETAAAQREAEAALQANPDLDVFLIMWDNGAQAVVQALKSAGLEPNEVWVTGSDASKPSLAYIAQGWQSQTTWTPIDRMAMDAANIAHALGSGTEPQTPTEVVNGVPTDYVPLTSVTKDNLCEFIADIAPKGWVSTDEVFSPGNNPCG